MNIDNIQKTYSDYVFFLGGVNWDGRCYPEEWSFVDGYNKAEYVARVEAFGAIRRAATIARILDSFNDDISDDQADWVRAAIRMAIRSDKT